MAKRALCVGINDYPGTASDLFGCVNDARDWQAALEDRNFETSLLLDKDATKQNLVDAISRLLEETASGDTGVLTYSGHGSWRVDESGDEADQRDELLCPHDINKGKFLSDDELFDLFVDRHRGAQIVFISDSCHSGSVAKVAVPGEDDDGPTRIRFLPPEHFLPDDELARARALGRPKTFKKARTTALLLGGCQDTEFSFDASFSGRPNGAFTYVALKAMKKLPKAASYSQWIDLIREQLPSAHHPQTPGLQGTRSQRAWKIL